jgi:transcriptional regulator with XRE-family HTH domain
VAQGLTWKQVAEKIGVGVTMLMMVKSGRRNLSNKTLYRLEQAEVAAGLQPPTARETLSFKQENSDLEKGVKRFRAKLAALDPKSQKRMLKALLQILDVAQRKVLRK